MPTYACKTRDRAGTVIEKIMDGTSKRDVLRRLEESGLSAIKISESRAASTSRHEAKSQSSPQAPRAGHKVKRKELLQFSLQLSSSMAAGVPILAGIRSIRQQTASKPFKAVLDQLMVDLEGGLSLSAAMALHSRAFPAIYVGTIEAGEKSGTLDAMLDNLADYLEGEMEVRSDVTSAVLYPAIVITTLIFAISILIIFVVPRFAAFYSGFNAELPFATRILIDGSTFVSSYFVWLLMGAGASLYGAVRLAHLQPVREFLDRSILRVPFLGRLVETATTLYVVQMLGLFTRAGVPVLEGMQTIAKTTGNTKIKKDLQSVSAGIAVGQSLAEGMAEVNCFPLAARHMLASGEATGSMERACFSVARHYKKELRYLTKNVATLIEPLLTLVLAGVVLFVALAAFLPMWDLVKVIGK